MCVYLDFMIDNFYNNNNISNINIRLGGLSL